MLIGRYNIDHTMMKGTPYCTETCFQQMPNGLHLRNASQHLTVPQSHTKVALQSTLPLDCCHWEQFRVQRLSQGHFDLDSQPLINLQRSLPPKLQLPHKYPTWTCLGPQVFTLSLVGLKERCDIKLENGFSQKHLLM